MAAVALLLLWPGVVSAQDSVAQQANISEEVEPRFIGTTGTTTIGFSGFVDRFASSRTAFPTNYTVQVDATRFITSRIAALGALAGSGSIGDDTSESATGSGPLALHASAGAAFFFTPQSIASLYAGASYWNQLTRRADSDAGSLLGLVGLQGAMSSRAAFYVEGGYGASLTRGEHRELVVRILGRVGFRLKL